MRRKRYQKMRYESQKLHVSFQPGNISLHLALCVAMKVQKNPSKLWLDDVVFVRDSISIFLALHNAAALNILLISWISLKISLSLSLYVNESRVKWKSKTIHRVAYCFPYS